MFAFEVEGPRPIDEFAHVVVSLLLGVATEPERQSGSVFVHLASVLDGYADDRFARGR